MLNSAIISVFNVLNNFIRKRVTAKSNDFRLLLVIKAFQAIDQHRNSEFFRSSPADFTKYRIGRTEERLFSVIYGTPKLSTLCNVCTKVTYFIFHGKFIYLFKM